METYTGEALIKQVADQAQDSSLNMAPYQVDSQGPFHERPHILKIESK